MTIAAWLPETTERLQRVGVTSARLDCLILLEDALGKDRASILAHPETIIPGQTLEILGRSIERRVQHEPLACIRGFVEFYGRKFVVTKDVLVPRPETEDMIDLLKQAEVGGRWKVEDMQIVDVGTGSGALAITAKLEIPKAEVYVIDIDIACLRVAKKNAVELGANVTFLESDLLSSLLNSTFHLLPSIVLANLPYVPDNYEIDQAARHEPEKAIFGGKDGLDLYRRLFEQSKQLSSPPKWVLTESLTFQHEQLWSLALASGYDLMETTGLAQCFRLKP